MIRKTAIQAWFEENDRYFDNPPKALAAGFSLVELAWMYEQTFGEFAVKHLAQDLSLHSR